jgi:hypothetical protein
MCYLQGKSFHYLLDSILVGWTTQPLIEIGDEKKTPFQEKDPCEKTAGM